jgi:hypothetical protein
MQLTPAIAEARRKAVLLLAIGGRMERRERQIAGE